MRAGLFERAGIKIDLTKSASGAATAAAIAGRAPKDFVGKTFAAAAVNDITMLALRTWMETNGADASTVKIVEIPQGAAPAALEAGRIDAIMVSNPAYTLALAALCQRMHRTPQTTTVLAGDIQPVIDLAVKYNAIEKGFPARELISDAALK